MQTGKKRWLVIFASLNASLGIAYYAYVFVVFNPLQKLVEDHIFPGISTVSLSLIASSPFIGGLFGAAVTELIGQKLGRRSTLMYADIISIIGTGLTMIFNFPLTIIGRTLTGVTAGIATVLTNIYIAEISKDPLRTTVGMIPNIAFSIGPIMAFVIGTFVKIFIEHGIPEIGYRVLLSIPAIISVIKIINFLMFFRFETPFYLVLQMKEREAEEVLAMLYDENHKERLEEIMHERDYIFEKATVNLRDLFTPKYRRAFLVSLILYVSPFTTGMIVPLTFSNMIFSEGAGSLDSELPVILTNLVGVFNFIGAFVALFLINTGKKPIAFIGYTILFLVNLAIVIIGFTDSIANMAVKVLVIVSIFLISSSVRPLSYSYPAETLPEIGVCFVVTAKWVAGFLITQAFLPLREALWYTGIYVIFTLFNVLTVVIIYFYMIETKGRSKLEALKLYGELKKDENSTLLEKEA